MVTLQLGQTGAEQVGFRVQAALCHLEQEQSTTKKKQGQHSHGRQPVVVPEQQDDKTTEQCRGQRQAHQGSSTPEQARGQALLFQPEFGAQQGQPNPEQFDDAAQRLLQLAKQAGVFAWHRC